MIYDCFSFFNELDILEIRLNILDGIVDKFVLVEATKTHSGKEKPLYYKDNIERFSKFKDKIIHIIVDEFPDINTSWEYENYQRNCIAKGLADAKENDIILISDVDEIPNPDAVRNNINNDEIKIFEQNMYFYYLNYLDIKEPIWKSGTRMLTYKQFQNGLNDIDFQYCEYFVEKLNKGTTATKIRMYKDGLYIKNGGWHFSYLGGTKAIINKITAFAHQEFNNEQFKQENELIQKIYDGKDLYNRNEHLYRAVKLNPTYPKYILDNQEKYKNLIFNTDAKYNFNYFIKNVLPNLHKYIFNKEYKINHDKKYKIITICGYKITKEKK